MNVNKLIEKQEFLIQIKKYVTMILMKVSVINAKKLINIAQIIEGVMLIIAKK